MDECIHCGNVVSEIGCLDCFPQSPGEIRDENIREGFNEDGEAY